MPTEDGLSSLLATSARAYVLIVGDCPKGVCDLAAVVRAAGHAAFGVRCEDALPALRCAKFTMLLMAPAVDAATRDEIVRAYREALQGRVEQVDAVGCVHRARRLE